MDTEEADNSAEATEKRRKTASQPLPAPDRSAEALEIVERERMRKYNKVSTQGPFSPMPTQPLTLKTHTSNPNPEHTPINLPYTHLTQPTTTSNTQTLTPNLNSKPYTSSHAYAERQEILATIEAVQRRNTSADLFFKVNAKIYIDEAAKLGTNLTVEVFEPVLDEEGDIKNMVMYMVAETIGDLPLEVKWWTGRMDDNNKPIREEGEMAIADWGELHRNTTVQTKTKNRNINHYSIKDTITVYFTALPHQVLATGPPEQESERDILQRSRGRRNLQETESGEGVQASKEGQGEHQEQRRAIYPRKGGRFFSGNTTRHQPNH